jgi:hypothetical protein
MLRKFYGRPFFFFLREVNVGIFNVLHKESPREKWKRKTQEEAMREKTKT